jgi:hypothetical protein
MLHLEHLYNALAKGQEKIVIGDSLNLSDTRITALPDNLTVEGSLHLFNTRHLSSLPANLTVRDNIYLRGTGITALPDTLKVGGKVCGLEENLRQSSEQPSLGGPRPL